MPPAMNPVVGGPQAAPGGASPAAIGRSKSISGASSASGQQHRDLHHDVSRALLDLQSRMENVLEREQELKSTFEVMHGGHPDAALLRFLKARELDAAKAEKMLTDCLRWRVKNDVDNILACPLEGEKYEKIRASQQYGMTGFDSQGRPVLCVRVGLSFMDPSCKLEEYVHSHIQHNEFRDRVLLPEASARRGSPVTTSVKIYDMSGLKLAHLGRMQMHRAVAAVDDLNYPEKSEVYYVVNAPTVFGACWKAIKPLLQERTTRKVRVLDGNGADELLQDMDESVLPHFVKYAAKEGLGSTKNLLALATHPALTDPSLDCCSVLHWYHVQMQQFMLKLKERVKSCGELSSKLYLLGENDAGANAMPKQSESLAASAQGEEMDIGAVLEDALNKVGIA